MADVMAGEARRASRVAQAMEASARTRALFAVADALEKHEEAILQENAKDLEAAVISATGHVAREAARRFRTNSTCDETSTWHAAFSSSASSAVFSRRSAPSSA